MRRLAALLAIGLALVGAGCGGGDHSTSSGRAPAGDGVTELRSIGQLRGAFNAHEGVPRLIVLASPT
jgi:hypothetical protein